MSQEETAVGTAGPAGFEPVIVGFTCNWCSYRAADLAGTARVKYPPNIRLVRLMCSGRLDPTFVLRAFADGADGVMVTGCWPGDCHYRTQNVYALRRFRLLARVLEELGIERGRTKLVWASAAEGARLAREFSLFIDEVRALGPLGWSARGAVQGLAAGAPPVEEAAAVPVETAPGSDLQPAEASA